MLLRLDSSRMRRWKQDAAAVEARCRGLGSKMPQNALVNAKMNIVVLQSDACAFQRLPARERHVPDIMKRGFCKEQNEFNERA